MGALNKIVGRAAREARRSGGAGRTPGKASPRPASRSPQPGKGAGIGGIVRRFTKR